MSFRHTSKAAQRINQSAALRFSETWWKCSFCFRCEFSSLGGNERENWIATLSRRYSPSSNRYPFIHSSISPESTYACLSAFYQMPMLYSGIRGSRHRPTNCLTWLINERMSQSNTKSSRSPEPLLKPLFHLFHEQGSLNFLRSARSNGRSAQDSSHQKLTPPTQELQGI